MLKVPENSIKKNKRKKSTSHKALNHFHGYTERKWKKNIKLKDGKL